MKVKELKVLIHEADEDEDVFFFSVDDNPLNDAIGIRNAFKISGDSIEGFLNGIYLQGN